MKPNWLYVIAIVISVVGAAVTKPAVAGPYLGASAGVARADTNCGGLSSCDATGSSYQITAGYRFTMNWAAEANYSQDASVDGSGSFNGSTLTLAAKAKSLGVGAAYFVPFNDNWIGVLRGGVATVRTTMTVSSSTLGMSEKQSRTEPYVGAGLSYLINPRLSLDATYNYKRLRIDELKVGVQSVRLGLSYYF